jgi:hypothetical protein
MAMWDQDKRRFRRINLRLSLALLALVAGMPQLQAAQIEDYDSYKIKLEGLWFYSRPTGASYGTARNGFVDLQQDIGFNNYSTFSGKLDWKFTRKNHLYFAATPFDETKTVSLNRTVVFQGQTFTPGLVTTGEMKANAYAVGYQYDFIRRKRGHLGIAVQANLYDTKATLNAGAQVTGGVPHIAVRASGSLLAPLPVAGPDVRLYFFPRLFVTGNLMGMYFFGYGNYISTIDTLGLTLIKNHLSARAGYSVASRLTSTLAPFVLG